MVPTVMDELAGVQDCRCLRSGKRTGELEVEPEHVNELLQSPKKLQRIRCCLWVMEEQSKWLLEMK